MSPLHPNLYRDLGALPAAMPSRAIAFFVDGVLLLLVATVAFLGFGTMLLPGEITAPPLDADGVASSPIAADPSRIAALLIPVFLFWLWNRVIRVSRGGASIGMNWAGIRMVSVRTGTSPTADQAVMREAIGVLLVLPLGLGLLPALTDPERRGLHDRAAGMVYIQPPE